MKGRIFYSYLAVLLCLTGLTTHGFAQTITTVTFSPATVCAGSGLTVTFTTSSSFAVGNVFTAYLSDVVGGTYPTTLGTLASRTGGNISGTIPSAAVNGDAYRIQIVASNATKASSLSTLTISVPAAPSVTTPSPYCEGTTASALVATGQNLKWYGTSQSGGTSSSIAPVPSTAAAFIGNFNYYVSQTVGGCESPRAAITVTVKDAPPTPATNPVTYCVGQTASALTATPVSAGATLNWYGTLASGGSPSSVSPVPSTTIATTTTYYVSQTLNGCEGPRASLTVTVNGIPSAPTGTSATYCEGSTAQPLTATGQNLKWYGTSQTGGSGSSNATVPNTATLGTTAYYVTQTVNGCESPRTGISVQVKDSPNAPGTSTIEFCQGVVAPTLTVTLTAGATPNWYGTAASGGSPSGTAPILSSSTAGTTIYYVSQTQNGCESPRASLTVRVKATPSAPGVSSIGLCNNSTAVPLTATGSGLKWYDAADAPLGGAPTPNTNTLGSQTYKVSQTVESCEGPKATITVTINAIPSAPVGTSVTYCEGSSAQPLAATGQNLRWYGISQTGGTSSGTPNTPSTTTLGTTLYYVTQTVNNCESPRVGIPVFIKDTPIAPGTTAIDFCQGSGAPTLTATLVANATPNWYGTSASGGIASGTAPTPSNSTVGTTVYYVSQTLNGCEGPRASLAVRVKAIPGAPGVSPVSFCNNGPAQPLTATGSGLKWYDASDSPLGGAPTPNTGTVGSQTYKVSQTVESCESPKATLTVTINSIPASPTGTSPSAYCEGSPAQALVATGQNLRWYGTNQTGGSGSSNATVPSTAASAIGSITYYVTQTVNGCESSRTGIPVQVKDTPDAPGTSLVEFCQNYGVPTLTATLVANATPNWYGTSASGGTASSSAPVPTNSTVGTTIYYVSQTLSGCEGPRASLSVRVKSTPGVPGVSPISFCNNSQAQPLTANGTNLKWYDASDNSIGNTPVPNTGTVGNQVYKVSQTSSEGCEGPKASITVVINPLPGQPSVSNVNYCQVQQDQPPQNVTSLASNASGQNLKWYNSAGSLLSGAPIPSITTAGTQSYQVSQTVNNCEGGKATIQVTVNTLAAPTTPKPLVVYCLNDKATPLEAIGESGSQLKWIDPYGRVTNDAPTPLTLNTNVQPGGDPFYVYQIGTNGCYSPRATIKAIVTSPPTLALVAPVSTVNLGQKAPLQLKFTSSGPYSYTLTGGYSGTSLKADTTISVLPRGNTIYQVITVSNGCGIGLPGSPATAQVNVIVPTVSTSSLSTTTLCSGTSLTVPFTTTGQFNSGNAFRMELVSTADTSKKYAVSATATSSPVTGSLPLTLPGGQYFVRVKADNPDIAIIGSNSPTSLTVRSVASATLTGTQTIYEGTPANLTLTFGGDGPWTATYADSLRSYTATTSSSPYIFEARPVRSTTYRLTAVRNVCGNGPISGTAIITVAPLLGVDDNSLDPLVKTYPVPTQTVLSVELDLPLTRDPATLSLMDAQGRPVLQHTTRNQRNELDMTTQPNGLYFLRIQVGDRQTVRKVLKQ
ncbi:hypothetical protein GCM10028808_11370 [Spirosoma migulaei]